MSGEALVVFTPSGKRGRFPVGTPLLTAARKLGPSRVVAYSPAVQAGAVV